MKRWFCIFFLLVGTANATTYYISSAGDNSDGLTWAKGFIHADSLNNHMAGGDTALIGDIDSYDMQLVPPTGGSYADRTVYACSTFTTDSSWTGKPRISNASLISTWTLQSGNLYWAAYTPGAGNCGGKNNWSQAYVMTQNDSLLVPRSSKAAVTQAGMFYHDGDSVFCWAFGGGDPDAKTMRIACSPTVLINSNTQDHLLFWGLELTHGEPGVVQFEMSADSVRIEHCNLRFAGSPSGENPAIVRSEIFTSQGWGEYSAVLACSLSSIYPVDGTPPNFSGSATIMRGAGAILYTQRFMTFDSCVFFDLPGPGVYWKMATGAVDGTAAKGNVVKNSEFLFSDVGQANDGMGCGVITGSQAMQDSIYGNTFLGMTQAGIQFGNANGADSGGHFACNNSFDSCTKAIWIYKPISEGGTNIIKYNVGSNRATSGFRDYIPEYPGVIDFWAADASTEAKQSIDSNMWIDGAAPDTFLTECDGAAGDWDDWQACGFDVNGDSTGTGFDDPANGDWDRTGVSNEMNVTYGGRTWIIYGANQPPPDSTVVEITGDVEITGNVQIE
ncbi:hypothetical protein KAR91_84125 [Candidatus Pacearchaeota archaeon]|nr:hypothetical protein [Candidatus Pacearchaeota archaeon]